ncbi:MAG: hypothetical protein JWN80_32 [Microbacteriaceae bacterium]|nr:hypothetical protein [Microbacteriaceae bacterium]
MSAARRVLIAVVLVAALSGCTSATPAPTNTASTPGTTAATLNRCAERLAPSVGRTAPLELTASFDDAFQSDSTINGTVVLTNRTSSRVTGTTAATPIVTLSRNGRVLWHTNGAMIAMAAEVDLAPGASMTYPASFSPMECAAQDDADNSFRENLPRVPVGRYDVSAAIDLTGTDGTSTLITGPLTRIRIR